MKRVLAIVVLGLALFQGCASHGPQPGDDEYSAGIALADKGDVNGAIKSLEEGVGQYPKNVKLRFGLARLQYESGERIHLDQLAVRLAGSKAEEDGKKAEAQRLAREGQDLHNKAVPFYKAARDNLKTVVQRASDEIRLGWAYYLLMRCSVFFEEWETAADQLEKAIEFGKPQGALLGQWQEYQRALKKETERRKRRGTSS